MQNKIFGLSAAKLVATSALRKASDKAIFLWGIFIIHSQLFKNAGLLELAVLLVDAILG
jgi:hypothetical protein